MSLLFPGCLDSLPFIRDFPRQNELYIYSFEWKVLFVLTVKSKHILNAKSLHAWFFLKYSLKNDSKSYGSDTSDQQLSANAVIRAMFILLVIRETAA